MATSHSPQFSKSTTIATAPANREGQAKSRLHLYLSPHLDDVILSCGGLIDAQRQAGERVGVLTLCAGSPDRDALSPLARFYEADWGESGDAVAMRRAENAVALSKMGVSIWNSTTVDAIYRNDAGSPYYSTREDLFREPQPRDVATLLPVWESQVKQIVEEYGQSFVLYSPLGVGGHVDHELARQFGQRMAELGCEVCFYEDYPYVELVHGGVHDAMARFGPRQWSPRVVAIDVRAKTEAVREYRSQIGRVFGSDREMIRRISGFTAEAACALNRWERMRRCLAPSGLRLRLWRRILGYHAHAERIWTWS
jgi:LmbE family N-acetylglucosaminyl deacetylase